MTKVFIAGSRHLSRLDADLKRRIDTMIEKGFTILVGDAMPLPCCEPRCADGRPPIRSGPTLTHRDFSQAASHGTLPFPDPLVQLNPVPGDEPRERPLQAPSDATRLRTVCVERLMAPELTCRRVHHKLGIEQLCLEKTVCRLAPS